LLALLFFGRGQVNPAAPVSTPEPTLTLVTAAPVTAAPETPGPTAQTPAETQEAPAAAPEEGRVLEEDGSYTTAEDLVLYLQTYGHLPPNFVQKGAARAAGWDGGSLEAIMPGKCIGGDSFGNQEGLLPRAKGRSWRECDINTLGKKSRGSERLIWSNDGLIYYTGDHYESFTLVYSP
jgi:hypothetical protein